MNCKISPKRTDAIINLWTLWLGGWNFSLWMKHSWAITTPAQIPENHENSNGSPIMWLWQRLQMNSLISLQVTSHRVLWLSPDPSTMAQVTPDWAQNFFGVVNHTWYWKSRKFNWNPHYEKGCKWIELCTNPLMLRLGIVYHCVTMASSWLTSNILISGYLCANMEFVVATTTSYNYMNTTPIWTHWVGK